MVARASDGLHVDPPMVAHSRVLHAQCYLILNTLPQVVTILVEPFVSISSNWSLE